MLEMTCMDRNRNKETKVTAKCELFGDNNVLDMMDKGVGQCVRYVGQRCGNSSRLT